MILVTGATGNAGGAVVRALVEAGEPVRALVRDTRAPLGAELVRGDLNDPSTIPFEGVDAVFFLSGYPAELFAAARDSGVERAVLLSGSSTEHGDRANAISRYQMDSEDALKGSGLRWTILRPNAFFANVLRWRPQLRAGDVIREAFPHVRSAAIDNADIAAVAVHALTGPGHEGRAYRLTGPEPLTQADRVRILADVLERPLTLDPFSDEEARADMAANMPQEYVDAFMAFYVEGTLDESQVLPTVEQITGRVPRTFAQWAAEHAGDFG